MSTTPDQNPSTPTNPPSTPPVELYPMTDIRFVLVRIGELSAKVDRLVSDVGDQGKKISDVQSKISFVKGAIWVFGAALTLGGAILAAYFAGKFKITFR